MRSCLLAALLCAAVPAAAGPFGAAVADSELAAMRGGIALPGGVTAAIGVALETWVDGRLAVRTQFSTEAPGVMVFAGGPGLPGAPGMRVGGAPSISVERNNIGTTVTVLPAAPAANVRVGGSALAPAGAALPLAPNGPGVETALGTVSLRTGAGGFVTELSGPTLTVQQLVGTSVGTIVANNADNRVIDTVTDVSIQISGQLLRGDIGATLGALLGGVR